MQLGPYVLQEVLGRGGAGVVHKARDPQGAVVAIKLCHRLDRDPLARFSREVRLAADLGPGFVPVLDAGDTPHGPYLVMPFLAGGSLRQRLERCTLPIEESVALVRALAEAMGRAHARGIVHRDLKPDNVLFDTSGAPLIADLGLAKHFDRSAPGASKSLSVTKGGTLVGTLGYAPPEQLRDAKEVGPAADVFALGAILYETLAGVRAFGGESWFEVVAAVHQGAFEPLSTLRPQVPAALEEVVRRALAAEPGERHQDGAELAAALDEVARRGFGRRSRRRVTVVAALVAALAVAVLAVAGALAVRSHRATRVVAELAQGRALTPTLRNAEAEACFDRALALAPRSGDALRGRARVRFNAGRRDEGLADLAAALALVADEPRALFLRAQQRPASDPIATAELARALPGLRALAERGDLEACGQLGAALADGLGVARDPKEALGWLRRAFDGGNLFAFSRLRALLTDGPPDVRDEARGLEVCRAAAAAGSVEGTLWLGIALLDGRGVARDAAQGTAYVREAAEAGSATAMVTLALVLGMVQGAEHGAADAEAVVWLRRAADLGHADSMAYLADRHLRGAGVTRDDVLCARWARRSAEAGSPLGMKFFGTLLLNGQGVAKDVADAVEWFRRGAALGNTDAMNNLAVLALGGDTAAIDSSEGLRWLEKAAESGSPIAVINLGLMLTNGTLPRDEPGSVRWLRRAASAPANPYQPRALHALAGLLTEGQGAPKDEAEAFGLYRRAADAGFAPSMVEVGRCLQAGRGVAKDEAEAVRWLEKGAAQGSSYAMAELGETYAEGRGVEVDLTEAARWRRRGSEAGSTWCMYKLGLQRVHGEGVEKNAEDGVRLLTASAEGGNSLGMYYLGERYEAGDGVPRDDAVAFKWFKQSADLGGAPAAGTLLGIFYRNGRGTEVNLPEARRWLEWSAEDWNHRAQHELGTLLRDGGPGLEKDEPQALVWLRRAAAEASGFQRAALTDLGAMLAGGRGAERDEAEGSRLLTQAIDLGEPRALVELARLLGETATQVPRDRDAARGLLARAVDQREPSATALLERWAGQGDADAAAVLRGRRPR